MNVSDMLERLDNEGFISLNAEDDIAILLMSYIDEISEDDDLQYRIIDDVVEFSSN